MPVKFPQTVFYNGKAFFSMFAIYVGVSYYRD